MWNILVSIPPFIWTCITNKDLNLYVSLIFLPSHLYFKMSEVSINSKSSKWMMKERKIKEVGPSRNDEDTMSSTTNKKIVTKRKSVKKKHI